MNLTHCDQAEKQSGIEINRSLKKISLGSVKWLTAPKLTKLHLEFSYPEVLGVFDVRILAVHDLRLSGDGAHGSQCS